jgi:ABC-2 type transport system ATP-binding protein
MSAALEVLGLTKNYKKFSLRELSFTLEEGCIMGFIGPNGAGKSTTIKAILNQIRRDAGEIRLWGRDNIREETEIKKRLGVVLDEGHFYGHASVKRMKNIVASFFDNWSEETFQSYVREFELDESKKISELSKGTRMKFAIALALSHGADLLIMDEPTSGLDPLVRDELLGILQRLIQDERKSVFFSTHITSDLDKVSDYIVLLNDGQLLLNEPKDEILERHALVKGPSDLLNDSMKPLLVGVRQSGYGFEALTADRAAARRVLGDRAIFEKPSIEDIMLYYVRGGNGHAEFN